VTCSVTDTGGLSDSASFIVRVIDSTDPTIGVSTGESVAGSGWYSIASNDGISGVTIDVAVADLVGVMDLQCTDNGTDIGALDPSGASFVVLDGHHVVSCVAEDAAGNDVSAGATFDVDQTAPTIGASVTPPAAGTGWWNASTGAPTATFACDDATSGIGSCSDAVAFGEGADQSAIGTATDAAGNSSSATVTGIDVDLTPPTGLAFVGGGLADGGSYPYLFVPDGPTGCVAQDVGSGVASCEVAGYSTLVGSHVVSAVATDAAGNSATSTLAYEVLPWTLVGFAKPVDMTSVNTLKAGGSMPLKFEVFAGATELSASDVLAAFEQQQIDCTSGAAIGAPVTVATGGPGKKSGGVGGQLSTKWNAPDQPGTCWLVTVRTLDGSSLSAQFKLR
jgi:hypothetical protein